MRKEELRTYIENHESEMIEDLKSLIRIRGFQYMFLILLSAS